MLFIADYTLQFMYGRTLKNASFHTSYPLISEIQQHFSVDLSEEQLRLTFNGEKTFLNKTTKEYEEWRKTMRLYFGAEMT